MAEFLLQIDESERRALLANTSKPPKGIYNEELAAINTSLRDLRPNHSFIIEVPKGVNPNDVKVIHGLEMDAQFFVTTRDGNGLPEEAQSVRDHSRIYKIVTGLRLSRAITPLMLAADVLRRGLQDSCETASPDISAIMMALNAFKPKFSEAVKEVSALVREERREITANHLQAETVE